MKKLLCSVALIGMLAAPVAVQAQLQVGAFAAYHDDLEAFGIGAGISIPLTSIDPNVALIPDFTFFFPDDPFGYFEINGDVSYNFPVGADAPVAPFAFAGLNIGRSSVDLGTTSDSSTDIGLNLGGGVNFAAGSVNPFAGAKFEIQDATGFVIFGGIAFPVGS